MKTYFCDLTQADEIVFSSIVMATKIYFEQAKWKTVKLRSLRLFYVLIDWIVVRN